MLKIRASGDYPEVKLNKKEYESILKARTTLSHGLAMEEKYEILISNYLEFEQEILMHASRLMLRLPDGYGDFFNLRTSLNRRLVNLLTAARLYSDQLQQHVKGTIPDPQNATKNIKKLFSKEYDSSLEYRFMEALRNYVQHRGIPVHWAQFTTSSEVSGDKRKPVFSMELASQKKHLKDDPNFKKAILKEIPEEVDLKMAARVYIESFSRIQSEVRNLVEQDMADSRLLLKKAIASYRQVYKKRIIVLYAIRFDKTNLVESVPLLLDWDDVRIKLSKRNRQLVNLRNRYVSGQSNTHKK